ncbi:sulfotransferase family 2 domain-containing protein [Phaeodactylibacter sp.]|uniref:sulfotransferase family 2 domain-containing protein n=1 Tax=Phaeodactylibacter sp. TaxID=1940289 RepID=UPI0025F557EC|nr:sulfotransferase family 2 domain-containing protein [Phaeodactylibacter sp.]MCI4648304.1 sulfotransferase family protein [Phaeodactylibacter sp.]MCI5090427.1 sulfotransferase family protein [Phaeodactylibacter sp.]
MNDQIKRLDSKIGNQLELLSFHIPKSAGTSFRNMLRDVYGAEAVLRFDTPLRGGGKFRVEQQPFTGRTLPNRVRVLHGHFSWQHVNNILELPPDIPKITWLRDPVERVVSNYFYLAKRLREILDEEGRGINILTKMERSLTEYAQAEINQNRMSKFLEGLHLSDFRFVGILERMDEDLQRMADAMGWTIQEAYQHNATGKRKREITAGERAVIEACNAEDLALYQEALELRKQGYWTV